MSSSRVVASTILSLFCTAPVVTAGRPCCCQHDSTSRTAHHAAFVGTVSNAACVQEVAQSESLLSRLRSRLSAQRERLRARVRERIQNRLAEARTSIWHAPGGSFWYTNYETGYRLAQQEQKMLVVYFACETPDAGLSEFENVALAHPTVTDWLGHTVNVRVPVWHPHTDRRSDRALISDPAFADLRGKPGLAVIDLAGDRAELDGQVTFIRPLGKRSCTAFELATILGLPRATLTQRTMIYAVRMHPEQPQSTTGELSQYLLDQAERHSQHQADIQVQGHHNWDQRFHQISSGLSRGGSFIAKEVVAESWGWEESMVDAAIECVHSWRQSPGHWSAVRAPHHFFGYDMKRGANGKWYGTGLFGDTDRAVVTAN